MSWINAVLRLGLAAVLVVAMAATADGQNGVNKGCTGYDVYDRDLDVHYTCYQCYAIGCEGGCVLEGCATPTGHVLYETSECFVTPRGCLKT
jgi:hypothetical protein